MNDSIVISIPRAVVPHPQMRGRFDTYAVEHIVKDSRTKRKYAFWIEGSFRTNITICLYSFAERRRLKVWDIESDREGAGVVSDFMQMNPTFFHCSN